MTQDMINYRNLHGPFSPFTFALQSIRQKIITITRNQQHPTGGLDSQLDLEYLEHILALSLPLNNALGETIAYVRFPVAACFRSGNERPLLRYSGQYGAEKPLPKLREVYTSIETYVISIKDSLTKDDPIRELALKDIAEHAIITQYPQSLREIKGMFRCDVNDFSSFYVFLTCQPEKETEACPLIQDLPPCTSRLLSTEECPNPNSMRNGEGVAHCCSPILNAFRNHFFSKDTYNDLCATMKSIGTGAYFTSENESEDDDHFDPPKDYRILREILSTIHQGAVRLLGGRQKTGSPAANDDARRVFSVVFVMPTFDRKGKLGFQYIFTNEQLKFLSDLTPERLKAAIEDKERDAFYSIHGALINDLGLSIGGQYDESYFKAFGEIIQRITATRDIKTFTGTVEEEHLRTAILCDYAFRETTRRTLLKKMEKDLSEYFLSEDVFISYGQPFLLDQVFIAKYPDVMTTMANHPLSKEQRPTEELMESREKGYSDKKLLPPALHLLETVYLRTPLFLYPIYQHDAPILLCAWDAVLFSGHWQNLKSMVDTQISGIFTSIVNHELIQFKKAFDDSPNVASLKAEEAAEEFASKLLRLFLRFCSSLDDMKEISKEGIPIQALSDEKMRESDIKLPSSNDHGHICIPALKKSLRLPSRLFNEAAKSPLTYYARLYLDNFLGSWLNAERTRKITLEHSTRAAVAAIMSRNMAHNISSHVLSYWVAHLEKYLETYKTQGNTKNDVMLKKLDEISEGISQVRLGHGSQVSQHFSGQSRSLKQSLDLFKYLKQRMEFIAEITTTTPAWEKSFSVNDLIKGFTDQLAVLDNIARSEGFCYVKTDGCRKASSGRDRAANCDECKRLPSNMKGKDKHKDQPEPIKITYDKSAEKTYVSIPHGLVGRHAFYSILENFIRNSAKHGGKKVRDIIKAPNGKEALEFHIKLQDGGEDFWVVTISDNAGNCNDESEKDKDNKHMRVIDKLKGCLCDNEYVEKTGQVKRGNWGMKEIKISANFLRRNSVHDLFHEQKPPLAELKCANNCCSSKSCNEEESDRNVQMTIYLRKPKEVCILVSKGTDKKSLENGSRGINCYEIGEMEGILQRGNTISHRFILFNQTDIKATKEFIDRWRDQIPYKMGFLNKEGGNRLSSLFEGWMEWHQPVSIDPKVLSFDSITSEPDKFIFNLYSEFVKRRFGDKDRIYFRYRKEDSIGKQWAAEGLTCDYKNGDATHTLLVFDNHGAQIDELFNSKYYQKTSSSTSFGAFLTNCPDDGYQKKLILRELFEASLTRVMIIDERIWKNSQREEISDDANEYKSMDYTSYLTKMGITIIPVHNDRIGEDEKRKIVNNGAYEDIHFLIIHRGIVEKMGSDLLTQIITSKKYPFVLVDSGRGAPEENAVPQGARYIPISAIESLIQEGDKYSLIQTLFSIRREHKNAR